MTFMYNLEYQCNDENHSIMRIKLSVFKMKFKKQRLNKDHLLLVFFYRKSSRNTFLLQEND